MCNTPNIVKYYYVLAYKKKAKTGTSVSGSIFVYIYIYIYHEQPLTLKYPFTYTYMYLIYCILFISHISFQMGFFYIHNIVGFYNVFDGRSKQILSKNIKIKLMKLFVFILKKINSPYTVFPNSQGIGPAYHLTQY